MQKAKNPKTDKMETPALYATMWKLSTVEESNSMGTWYNWSVEKVGYDPKPLFDAAKDFRQSVVKGEAKAVQEETPAATTSTNDDDDIPF